MLWRHGLGWVNILRYGVHILVFARWPNCQDGFFFFPFLYHIIFLEYFSNCYTELIKIGILFCHCGNVLFLFGLDMDVLLCYILNFIPLSKPRGKRMLLYMLKMSESSYCLILVQYLDIKKLDQCASQYQILVI